MVAFLQLEIPGVGFWVMSAVIECIMFMSTAALRTTSSVATGSRAETEEEEIGSSNEYLHSKQLLADSLSQLPRASLSVTPARSLPPFLSLHRSSAMLMAHQSAIRTLGALPSVIPFPSAVGYLPVGELQSRGQLQHQLKCRRCQKTFQNSEELAVHVSTCSKVMLLCDYCDMSFARRFNLKVHMRCRHGIGEQLSCPACGITFRSKIRLESHHCSFRNSNASQNN